MNQNLFKELASLVPAQLDAGQVFTGTPTGKAVKGYNPLSWHNGLALSQTV